MDTAISPEAQGQMAARNPGRTPSSAFVSAPGLSLPSAFLSSLWAASRATDDPSMEKISCR